jgi:rubrerythrin
LPLPKKADEEGYAQVASLFRAAARAEKDGVAKAIDAIEDAGKAEAIHADWYKKALGNLAEWKGKKKDFYVCPLCGNVLDKRAGKCPICQTASAQYLSVN